MTKPSSSIAALLLSSILFLLIGSGGSSCGQSIVKRNWTAGKHVVLGELLDYDNTHVTLKTDKRDSVKVALDQLSAKDRQFISGLAVIDEDEKAYRLIKAQLDRFRENPSMAMARLVELADPKETSPYMAMLTGIALASEEGKYPAALRHFRRAEKLIKRRQDILGPGYHHRTMLAAFNNQLVCQIKMRKGGDAADLLTKDIEGKPKTYFIPLELSNFPNWTRLILRHLPQKKHP